VTDLRVFQSESLGQFLAIRFADVFLLVEGPFEASPLAVREDSTSKHPTTWPATCQPVDGRVKTGCSGSLHGGNGSDGSTWQRRLAAWTLAGRCNHRMQGTNCRERSKTLSGAGKRWIHENVMNVDLY
jgi:hypothetical protein